MITGYMTHDEAMVRDFIKNPEYADELLAAVISDGDEYEIQRVKGWYDEAQSRLKVEHYWDDIISCAEITAKSGQDIAGVIARVSEALSILKSAVPAGA